MIWTKYPDGDDWVVYNPASGDVHLLTAAARRLWELIAAGASSFDTLAMTLAGDLDRPVDEELTRATRDALASMDRVGLIRPTSR